MLSVLRRSLVVLSALAVIGAGPLSVQAAGNRAIVPPPAGMALSNSGVKNALTLNVAYAAHPQYLRQVVGYHTNERPGTIVIDTGAKHLYFVLSNGRALRYGIGVARQGFEWSGTHAITAKREWPSWTPPAEMLLRRPDIPKFMEGGPDNPLGARGLYIGSTLYRIHGTNEPWTIGGNVSSGCIRLVNADVIDLFSRVRVGAKVVVF